MEDVRHAIEGVAVLIVTYMVHAWALVYPLVTGTTALCSLIIVGHGAARIFWRWWHGYPNFLTDREKEKRQ